MSFSRQRATHIDIGNGAPLCGARTIGPTLTSEGIVSRKMCQRCQQKLERLMLQVRAAGTVPKLIQAQQAIRKEFGDPEPGEV